MTNITTKLVLVLAMTAMAVGCSKKSEDAAASTSSSLSISGSLSSNVSASVNSKLSADDVDAFDALTLSDLKFIATASTTPPSKAEATLGSDGSFTISLPDAKGAAISIAVFDSDGTQVGQVKFVDSSKKDLNGNSKKSTSIILSDSVALGAVTMNSDGEIEITVSSLGTAVGSSESVASGVAFDPTGIWYMKAYDGTVPSGYQTVGATCGDGPCIGFPVTLVRLAGKAFDPNGSCSSSSCASTDGTIGSDDKYALSIWGQSFSSGMGACGSKLGFTEAEARYYGRIHVASLPTVGGNSISFGPYVFTTPSGFGGDSAPYNAGWMKTGATASWNMQDCRMHTFTHNSVSYNGWACKSKVKTGSWPGSDVAGPVYGWQIGLEGGGCKNTSTGKPVMVSNWSNMGYGTCTTTDVSSTYGSGFFRNTCSYTNVDHDGSGSTANINLECSFTGGQVTDSSGPTSTALSLSAGQYLGQPETLLASGALCSSAGSANDVQKLAAYRCYANAYWSATRTGGCQRDYRFNWMTSDPTTFVDSGRGKPKEAFITNILNYSPSGTMAFLDDEERETVTVATGPSSSTSCEVARNTVMAFKKVSATRMLVDLRMTGQMKSTAPACVGAAKDALAGKQVQGGGDLQHLLSPQKMIFYLDSSL